MSPYNPTEWSRQKDVSNTKRVYVGNTKAYDICASFLRYPLSSYVWRRYSCVHLLGRCGGIYGNAGDHSERLWFELQRIFTSIYEQACKWKYGPLVMAVAWISWASQRAMHLGALWIRMGHDRSQLTYQNSDIRCCFSVWCDCLKKTWKSLHFFSLIPFPVWLVL